MIKILQGDCVEQVKTLETESVNCCITSPPYFGLRDYKVDGQIGVEKTPQEYVAAMVGLFREVWRVLRDDGTVWLNLGDSYCCNGKGGRAKFYPTAAVKAKEITRGGGRYGGGNNEVNGLKCKDLIGIPWLVAFALQADGWYLRSDIIWAKQNCMPESVTDRPTRSHEYIFLLSKSPKYYYDFEAIKEPCIWDKDGIGTATRKARARENQKSTPTSLHGGIRQDKQRGHSRRHAGFNERWDNMSRIEQCSGMKNKRDVWTVSPAQYRDAHFATFPPNLIRPCVIAGCPVGGVILDPFAGSGTTGAVALEHSRGAVLIELNQEYIPLIERRLSRITPDILFT